MRSSDMRNSPHKSKGFIQPASGNLGKNVSPLFLVEHYFHSKPVLKTPLFNWNKWKYSICNAVGRLDITNLHSNFSVAWLPVITLVLS